MIWINNMMMRSLKFKWSLTLVVTSLVGIVLVGLLASQINVSEYQRFRNAEIEATVAESASEFYAEFHTWDGIDNELFGTAFRRFRDDSRRQRTPFIIANADGVIVKPSGSYNEGDFASLGDLQNGSPIWVNGKQIGTLMITLRSGFNEAELSYLERTNNTLLVGAGGAVAVAVLLGVLMSRQFLRPLAELTTAIENVKHGKFDQRVPVRTHDELGELASAFNQMGEELQRANKLRRQMTADIAHELRTPLTVISGYLEGLRDGSLQPTQARFDTLFQEAQLLKRLIEDLRTLSVADAGELKLVCQTIAPQDLLEQVVTSFTPLADSQSVTLNIDSHDHLPLIDIDRDRMVQVLGNLVSNSLRFTPEYGTITLSAFSSDDNILLTIRDTGSGIAPEYLDNIFARFYRASESRQQSDSESGLGLAIAKSIVTAHGGHISAESELGQGTTITIHLPMY
jgi:two-component system, OmpR family, sensor histidine kinase BaeS